MGRVSKIQGSLLEKNLVAEIKLYPEVWTADDKTYKRGQRLVIKKVIEGMDATREKILKEHQ